MTHPTLTYATHLTHATHVTHLTHPTYLTHLTHPTHLTHLTHPTHLTHVTHPTCQDQSNPSRCISSALRIATPAAPRMVL
jgi:hypothetical protein